MYRVESPRSEAGAVLRRRWRISRTSEQRRAPTPGVGAQHRASVREIVQIDGEGIKKNRIL